MRERDRGFNQRLDARECRVTLRVIGHGLCVAPGLVCWRDEFDVWDIAAGHVHAVSERHQSGWINERGFGNERQRGNGLAGRETPGVVDARGEHRRRSDRAGRLIVYYSGGR